MLTSDELRHLLELRFLGSDELAALPIKTRGKKARIMVCEAFGWVTPRSFPRTQPRFPQENFDIFVQAASNLQLWNRPVNVGQRYVIVILDAVEKVKSIRVLSGYDVSELATSDRLTSKLQARFPEFSVQENQVVVQHADTEVFREFLANYGIRRDDHPMQVGAMPGRGLMSIEGLAAELQPLVGKEFSDPGATQERLRGQQLHVAVCEALRYDAYADSGQHPDLPNQLLEIKLQMSPTIDLGLVDPASEEPLPEPFPTPLRVADVRYAVFGASKPTPQTFRIDSAHLVPGAKFYQVFEPMGGLGTNKKLQIRLPREWFV